MSIKIPGISLSNLPFFKSPDTFAIDIGTGAVKILNLKVNGNRYSLVKWAVLPLAEAKSEVSPQERKNAVVAKIAEYFAKEKLATSNVISSVSGNQVIVRYVRFPKLTREELNKTIQFEAEPYIPFDIRDVDLSFHILGDVVEEGQKKMEAILVAAKKEAAQSKLEILNEVNLRPVVMDIDAFAITNAYEMNTDPSTNETVLVMNIGNTTTNMAIIEHFVPRVVRDVFISGSSFTKAVQKNMGCEMKAAEDMKIRYGLLVTAEEKEKTLAENQKEALQVSNALSPVAKDLVGEVQRSIDFYISQNPERNIHRLLLCGGSAQLKNLDKYLAHELKMPVERFNPLKNIQGGEAVPEPMALQLAVAVGLASRRENDIEKK